MAELWTERIKVPAEVEELNRCIARLQERSGQLPVPQHLLVDLAPQLCA